MTTISSTMAGIQSVQKSSTPSIPAVDQPTNSGVDGFLSPLKVDEMIRIITASSPGIDICDLPIVIQSRQEKEARTNGTTSPSIQRHTISDFAFPKGSAFDMEENESKVTIRIMVAPKDGPVSPVTTTHELFELNPKLSYIQLHDTLRRFLLKYSKGDVKSRANLSGCVFTPDHQFYKIKAIWSNVAASGTVGESAWGGPSAAVPSSDTFITEDNCSVILNAMEKRAGALDTLVLITWVPED